MDQRNPHHLPTSCQVCMPYTPSQPNSWRSLRATASGSRVPPVYGSRLAGPASTQSPPAPDVHLELGRPSFPTTDRPGADARRDAALAVAGAVACSGIVWAAGGCRGDGYPPSTAAAAAAGGAGMDRTTGWATRGLLPLLDPGSRALDPGSWILLRGRGGCWSWLPMTTSSVVLRRLPGMLQPPGVLQPPGMLQPPGTLRR